MASIYIVNHTICAPYPETWSSYHYTEIEAEGMADDDGICEGSP